VARATSSGNDHVLSRRALNRALLARQLLLKRHRRSPQAAIEQLVGLQAQSPQDPYVALWSRLDGFKPDALSRLITRRGAVRLAMMRSTIHLVTASDCAGLRPLLQPALERSMQGTFGKRLAGLELAAVAAAGRDVVAEQPLTLGEIGTALARRWPGRDPAALGYAVRALVALVQPPPRGLWRSSGAARHSTAEAWLGRASAAACSPDAMVRRYLAAFGPASVADIQVWSGLTRLSEVVNRLRPTLRVFRDERGRELFDVPRGLHPDPDTPAPPRFLPEYDNILLSHADRTRIVDDAHRLRLIEANRPAPAVLIDGFVAATWSIEVKGLKATVTVRPFARLAAPDRAAVEEEGERLAAFLAPESTQHRVVFAVRRT
jgi:DNA glycosylase AlkZ-like